jgi:hypothetical protein
MGKRLTAAMVLVALLQAACLFVVPKTRRHERSAVCADSKTKVAQVHVWRAAKLDWQGCGNCGIGEILFGLLLSPITIVLSSLYTLPAVGFSHDRDVVETTFEPRCGLVVPPPAPPPSNGPPGAQH